jgi:hypothetical protein
MPKPRGPLPGRNSAGLGRKAPDQAAGEELPPEEEPPEDEPPEEDVEADDDVEEVVEGVLDELDDDEESPEEDVDFDAPTVLLDEERLSVR